MVEEVVLPKINAGRAGGRATHKKRIGRTCVSTYVAHMHVDFAQDRHFLEAERDRAEKRLPGKKGWYLG